MLPRERAEERIAASIARALHNSLFGISSAAQLLRFRVKDDPVVEKNVGRILREVERLNGMATSLLEYGRPAPLRLAPANPDTVWDHVLERQRGRLESRALVLARVRAEPPVRCAVDPEQLAQAFVDVLANAVDAAPEGSDLALTAARLGDGCWRCALRNGGAPIPADVLPHVFAPFVSTKSGATGIGLALCRRIVEEHGGTIAIESAPDFGTMVTITLPAAT